MSQKLYNNRDIKLICGTYLFATVVIPLIDMSISFIQSALNKKVMEWNNEIQGEQENTKVIGFQVDTEEEYEDEED